jgi:hypothetical protein
MTLIIKNGLAYVDKCILCTKINLTIEIKMLILGREL